MGFYCGGPVFFSCSRANFSAACIRFLIAVGPLVAALLSYLGSVVV